MADIHIEVFGNLAAVLAPLERLTGAKVERALGEGLNEGGDKVRTKVRKALREQTNVKRYGAITERVTAYRAGKVRQEYRIKGVGKALKIMEFPTRARASDLWMRFDPRQHWKFQARAGDGKFGPASPITNAGDVYSSPWNVGRTFKRSFVHPLKGMVAALRSGAGRWALRRLYGPSIAKEIVKSQSRAAFEQGVRADVVPAINKRLARILGG